MVEFEIPDKVISNVLKVGGALIVLVMVATLIRPSVTGNVVNRINLLSSDLSVCELELNETKQLLWSSEDAVEMLTMDISAINSQLYACSSKLNTSLSVHQNLSAQHESLETSYAKLSEDYATLSANYNSSEVAYLELAQFAAQKWCCVRKVDNPDINSYDISYQNNEIICRESNRGDFRLSC